MNILNNPNRASFYDFSAEQMTSSELFNTLGGIERNEIFEDVIVDLTFEDTVFDKALPDWSPKQFNSIIDDNFPQKSNLFFSLRNFRTLLCFFCIRFKS